MAVQGKAMPFTRLFRHFEQLVQPTGPVPDASPPPRLGAYFRYFTDQMRGLVVRLFIGGFLVAVLDTAIPQCIGRITGLLTDHAPGTVFADAWGQFVVMGAIVFIARPGAFLLQVLKRKRASHQAPF